MKRAVFYRIEEIVVLYFFGGQNTKSNSYKKVLLSPSQITVQTNTTDWKHLSVYYPHKIHVWYICIWLMIIGACV